MYETLLYEEKGPIAVITLNRPDRYNAVNEKLTHELLELLTRKLPKNPTIRTIVLTGSGKAFCSGQDLKEIEGQKRSLGASVETRYNPLVRAIMHAPQPILCALNGVAAGAGAGLALACDYIVAAESASFVFAFINIGLVLDTATSFLLPRLVGLRRAMALATLGERLSASQALAWGMINEITPDDKVLEITLQRAQKYAEMPPKAYAMIKKMLLQSFETPLDQALQREKWYQEIAGRTQDYQEGVQAFIEKRKPVFKGQ